MFGFCFYFDNSFWTVLIHLLQKQTEDNPNCLTGLLKGTFKIKTYNDLELLYRTCEHWIQTLEMFSVESTGEKWIFFFWHTLKNHIKMSQSFYCLYMYKWSILWSQLPLFFTTHWIEQVHKFSVTVAQAKGNFFHRRFNMEKYVLTP